MGANESPWPAVGWPPRWKICGSPRKKLVFKNNKCCCEEEILQQPVLQKHGVTACPWRAGCSHGRVAVGAPPGWALGRALWCFLGQSHCGGRSPASKVWPRGVGSVWEAISPASSITPGADLGSPALGLPRVQSLNGFVPSAQAGTLWLRQDTAL